jgi:surfeit locus 1 family protein
MTRRNLLALLLALVAASVCVRLGLWQLDRHRQRAARNALAAARLDAAPVAVAQLPPDPDSARYRRVRVTGRWDHEREVVLMNRARQGSPGVNLVTPLRPLDGSPAVLVNRGWIYSPDAATVDEARWREPQGDSATATIEGYVVEIPTAAREPRSAAAPRRWRALDLPRLRAAIPYEISPWYVIALGDEARGDVEQSGGTTAPVRLERPELGAGPHRSYAVQWFSFAAIALIGVSALIWQDTRRGRRALR